MKQFNVKPNYSALERTTGLNRHTISKYDKLGCVPARTRTSPGSKYDQYLDEIKTILELSPGVTIMATYQAIRFKHPDFDGTYNGFKSYLSSQGLRPKGKDVKAHVFFETEPGEQIQFDWKEDLSVYLSTGEKVEFNVLNMTFGYSRLHVFIYSKSKTEEDVIRCIIEGLRRVGGTCKCFLTDNMAAIVSCTTDGKKVHPKVKAFFEDLGCELKLCQVRSPETKGKSESANRFVDWVNAMNYQLDSEDMVIKYVEEHITKNCNAEKNQTTKIPPAVLFKKEKEYLHPLGNKILLDNYLSRKDRALVGSTLLVNYGGCGYSVPKDYIGKYVDMYVTGNELYIYHNKNLVTVHTLSQNPKNYKQKHYVDALKSRIKNHTEEDIEALALSNLQKLNRFGGN